MITIVSQSDRYAIPLQLTVHCDITASLARRTFLAIYPGLAQNNITAVFHPLLVVEAQWLRVKLFIWLE
jgi:hypothetical protein